MSPVAVAGLVFLGEVAVIALPVWCAYALAARWLGWRVDRMPRRRPGRSLRRADDRDLLVEHRPMIRRTTPGELGAYPERLPGPGGPDLSTRRRARAVMWRQVHAACVQRAREAEAERRRET